MVPHERNWREFAPEQPHPDIPYQCASVPFAARSHHWQGPGCENGKVLLFRVACWGGSPRKTADFRLLLCGFDSN